MSEVIVIESDAFNKLRDETIKTAIVQVEKHYKSKKGTTNWVSLKEAEVILDRGYAFISKLRAEEEIVASPQTGGRKARVSEKSLYDYLERESKKG